MRNFVRISPLGRIFGLFLGFSLCFGANPAANPESAPQGDKTCESCGFLVVNKNFALNKKIEARYLYADIHINSAELLRGIGELNDSDRKSLTTTLNSVIEEARKGTICKGGSYGITPIIAYEKNARKTLGQEVSFSLNCKFLQGELKGYNELLSKINKIVAQNRLLSLPQPSLSHRITSDEISAAKEEIFGEFLAGLSAIEAKYSKLLGKSCAVNALQTSDSYAPSPRVFAAGKAEFAMARNAATDTVAPIVREDEVNISVDVRLLCK